MANWPSSLPQAPTLEGYTEDSVNNRLESMPDQGAAKIRRRFTAVPEPVSERYVLNLQQVKDFKNWYNNTIEGGSLEFTKWHPIYETNETYRFRPGSTYSLMTIGTLFELFIELEVMP